MSSVFAGHAAYRFPPVGAAVAVGNFDGVHLGHRAILEGVRSLSARLGVRSLVYTFDPAPTAVVAPERHQPRLTTLAERVHRLETAGIDEIVVEPFTRAFADGTPEWFATTVLRDRLGAKGLVVGHDFRFGHARAGTLADFRQWVPAVEVVEVAPVTSAGGAVSSARGRKLLMSGQVEEANALRGRCFSLSGLIVEGQKRGRTLGFPTANLACDEEIRPAIGVYATRAKLVDGRVFPAVTNVGNRPTFNGVGVTVETFVIGLDEALYGQAFTVEFVGAIRGEMRFGSMAELKQQIERDVAAARARIEP